MAENDPGWERDVIEKLATASLKEQRRARAWGIFFKLLTFAYLTVIVLLAVEWKDRGETKGPHTALVEIGGIIAPGTDASAEKIITALNAALILSALASLPGAIRPFSSTIAVCFLPPDSSPRLFQSTAISSTKVR